MNHRALVWAACAPVAAALAASPNLLENSGFEFSTGRGNRADGWTLHLPPEGVGRSDREVCHSGQAALRLQVPPTAPLDWYQAYRSVRGLRAGVEYTISAWLRCQDVRGGAGAYISLNFFDGSGKRLGICDSQGKVSGTADWSRLSARGPVPKGASEMRAILCLHGHGTAWFDDVQVEEGPTPTEYQPSPADTDREQRRAADATAATAWIEALPARPPGRARIGVLDLGDPAGYPATGGPACPSDPATLVGALAAAGHAAFLLTPERLQNCALLDPAVLDLLVVPSGDLFPAAGHGALVEYLSRGGASIAMGGYAFDRPVIRHEGRWCDPAALPIPEAPATPVFGAGTAGWYPSSNRREGPELRAIEGPGGVPGLELATPDLEGWDSAISPVVEGQLPADWSVTRFWAKGDGATPKAWIEWSEKDGSRWHKAVALGSDWQEYRLTPADFTYWHDNPSVGRGVPPDRFRPEQARQFQVGIAVDIAAKGQPHRVWFAGVGVHADPLAGLRLPSPLINTRWGRIRDALWPEPEQIGVFDPAFPLREVARTAPAPDQAVVVDFALEAPIQGYSATAMLGLNGHGFGPNRARWLPLLECRDRFGRLRGHAGAIVHHFAGSFAGSSWAIFGVTSQDLFAQGSPATRQVLLPVVEALLRRLYLHETDAGYACYRQGETVSLRTRVSNTGAVVREAEVRFVVTADTAPQAPAVTLTRSVSLKPGEALPVELPWPLPPAAADLYRVTAELWLGGQRVDLEQAAFAVWSPAVLARGPGLHRDGARLLLDGVPQFLMGCQTYWGQNGSVTAHSPLAFDRDFRGMRDLGLRWTRCFIPFRTETDRRISDAIVQLAQKHGLVLYHTPNLTNTADPDELARQQATAREIAERYRGVPGLAIDICNEPAFAADDAGLLQQFGRAGKTLGEWQDADVTAFWQCMADAQRAWARHDAAAIHEVDAGRLVSVGWSQGWGGGESMKDPILASLDLDFTDRHYYGGLQEFGAELKDLDLRLLGKPLVLGECGAKNHPTFQAADPWNMGEDEAAYERRFLYLGHRALGLGAAALSSWHWRDPMEGVFPCGLAFSANVPRPAAYAMRAMALSFSRLRPAPARPPVCLLLPDRGRHSGARAQVIRAGHRASDLLAACGVDFGLLPDAAVGSLPAGVRVVVYPLPLDPADAVLERLAAFADAGGVLWISGDLSYDEQGQPVKRERLARLCGVVCEGGPLAAPLSLPPVKGPFEPVADSGLVSGEARPSLRLQLAGAQALATCGGEPVVTRFRLGQGQVWFSADPIELAPAIGEAHQALYRAVLAAGGVALPAPSAGPGVTVFRVAGEQADAWVFHNGSKAPAETVVGDWAITLAAGGNGFLLVGHDGSLRLAEAQGPVRRGGAEVLRVSGHAFVLAEDDLDLARSSRLLILPLAPGEVRVSTAQTAMPSAELGEFRDGQWTALAPAAAEMAVAQVSVVVPVESARQMLRIRW
jgi:hypothetical protein